MTTPSSGVVAAFDGDESVLAPLTGGQGEAWRAGGVVLKPADDEAAIAWTARLLGQVPDCAAFRLARPVPAVDGRWPVDGWAATGWVDGAHQPGRWEEILDVSAALHAGLRGVHVAAPALRIDPWTISCQVAWGHRPGWQPSSLALVALLEELAPLLHAPWSGAVAQVIHGDLGGNVLFADGLPPAVIDFSPHVAPAPFADAVIVADALAWEGAPRSLGERFACEQAESAQLLARAAAFRAVVAELLSGADDHRVRAEIAAYRPAVEIALRVHGWRRADDPE